MLNHSMTLLEIIGSFCHRIVIFVQRDIHHISRILSADHVLQVGRALRVIVGFMCGPRTDPAAIDGCRIVKTM